MSKTIFDQRSFASAETIPVKLFINEELWKSCVKNGRVIPIHLQLNPTNKCTFACTFCSCGNRDASLDVDFEELKTFIEDFKRLGGQAVTISGAGDPLEYPYINKLITYLYKFDILIGLVTNGNSWHRLDPKILGGVIWCRVSASDELPLQLKRHKKHVYEWLQELKRQMALYPNIDWALSYVLTKRPNVKLIAQLIEFANENNMTHVRIVSDIRLADQLEVTMEKTKEQVSALHVDDSIVNWQGRSKWVEGQRYCWLSLAKPVVAPDGYLYSCCGAQYALKEPTGDFPPEMRLGHMSELPALIASQTCFNGLICEKCYYQSYNVVLDSMKHSNKIKHREHI